MLTGLLFLHSVFRWLVLLSLLYALYRAVAGYVAGRSFNKTDDAVRHWAATIAHVQLMLGIVLYTQSITAKISGKAFTESGHIREPFFFGVIHLLMMSSAIVLITIGSAIARRSPTDRQKFKTILIWFGLGLLLILIAIPWPFSPLAQRPYLR